MPSRLVSVHRLLLTPHPDAQDTGFAVHVQVIPRGHPFVTATRYTKAAE